MRYASVCSGVEAASLAWEPLGWEPVWFSEVDKFPSAVLAHRFPHVPNLGDMTKIKCLDREKGLFEYEADGITHRREFGKIDLLVGGTPCQSFSIAGNQKGLGGVSGLALAYVELLESMRPEWFVWENVPGVFSTNGGADFARLVRAFDALGYSFSWRVLDVQYIRVDGFPYAIPQRRRRLFVVGYSGADWRYPAEVLFEPSCLSRSLAPRRIKRKGSAAGVEGGVASPISCINDQGGSIIHLEKGFVAPTLRSEAGHHQPYVTHTVRIRSGCEGGGKGALIGEELMHTMGTRNDQVIVEKTFALAENTIGRQVQNGGNGTGAQEELAYTQNATGVMGVSSQSLVRRITPIEAERLMGFPDDWTKVPWRGKGVEECPDSLRYKCCGNSMGVNVMRWLGLRIERVERMTKGM